MGDIERTKRRILRQAVADNVATLRRLPPPGLVGGRRGWRGVLLLASPFLLPTLLVAVALLWPSPVGNSGAPPTEGTLLPSGPLRVQPAQALDQGPVRRLLPPTQSLGEKSLEPIFPVPGAVDPTTLALGVRRVVLDPGHGGHDLGTTGPMGLIEKELTLDIALRAAELLVSKGFEVLLTREGDTSVPLAQRAALANAMGGDLLLSIHVNWIPNRRVRGVETYWLGPTDDPYIKELAAAENRLSGYSLADFRRLLEGIYAGVRNQESRRLAEAVHREMYRALARLNPELQDRGVKTAPFVVLVTSEIPAVLAEVSCLSNEEEARLLATPKYRRLIAEALTAGITSYAQQRAAAAHLEGSS